MKKILFSMFFITTALLAQANAVSAAAEICTTPGIDIPPGCVNATGSPVRTTPPADPNAPVPSNNTQTPTTTTPGGNTPAPPPANTPTNENNTTRPSSNNTTTSGGNCAFDQQSQKLCNPLPDSDLTSLIVRGLQYALGLLGTIAVVMIVVGGFRMVGSQGNEHGVTQAKKTIQWAIIGLLVALMAYAIVAIVQNLVLGTS